MVSSGRSPGAGSRRWPALVAGGLLVAVGGVNAALGLWELSTQRLEVGPGVAGGLAVAGAVTVAAGVLVSRGSRIVTLVALTIFALLLVVQLVDLAGPASVDGTGLARSLVLVVLVIALGAASAAARRSGRQAPGRRD
ncbi:hypothetical protein BH23ACT8_BH23ACT8_19370 [soil metagenome]